MFARPLARAMSTAAPARQQFLLVARDYTDADALSRRMTARPHHIANIQRMIGEGSFITGGAMLSETETVDGKPKMIGSMLLLKMGSSEEVRRYVDTDPYFTGKVWEKVSTDEGDFRIRC